MSQELRVVGSVHNSEEVKENHLRVVKGLEATEDLAEAFIKEEKIPEILEKSETIRHWPPEGFSQPEGVIQRYPFVVPNPGFRSGEIKPAEEVPEIVREKRPRIQGSEYLMPSSSRRKVYDTYKPSTQFDKYMQQKTAAKTLETEKLSGRILQASFDANERFINKEAEIVSLNENTTIKDFKPKAKETIKPLEEIKIDVEPKLESGNYKETKIGFRKEIPATPIQEIKAQEKTLDQKVSEFAGRILANQGWEFNPEDQEFYDKNESAITASIIEQNNKASKNSTNVADKKIETAQTIEVKPETPLPKVEKPKEVEMTRSKLEALNVLDLKKKEKESGILKELRSVREKREAEEKGDQNVDVSSIKIDGLNEFQLGRMNLSLKDIKREVPNFLELSKGQQRYIIAKLKERIDSTVRFKTEEGVRDSITNSKNGFGRAIKSIKNNLFFGKTTLKNRVRSELYGKSFEYFGDDLKQLTNFVKERGYDIEAGQEGFVTRFISKESVDSNHRKAINEFNKSASAVSETPSAWMQTTASSSEKKACKKAQKKYEEAKAELISIEKKIAESQITTKGDTAKMEKRNAENKILFEMANLNSEVRMSQFLTSEPEMENRVSEFLKSSKLEEKSVFFATGGLAKDLGKYAFGLGGGALASAIIGGIVANRRSKEQFRQNEAMQSAGYKVSKEGLKEMIKAEDYTKKITDYIGFIEKQTTTSKRREAVQTLKNRVDIVMARADQSLINWGRDSKQLKNKMNLFDAIEKANTYIYQHDFLDEGKVKEVYARFDTIFLKDGEKDEVRKEAIIEATQNGALLGAGLFTAGWLVRDVFQSDLVVRDSYKTTLDNLSKDTSGVAIPSAPENVPSSPANAPKIVSAEEVAPPKATNDFIMEQTVETKPLPTTSLEDGGAGQEITPLNYESDFNEVEAGGKVELNEKGLSGDVMFTYNADGKVEDVDISRVKSDDVIRFRQNPGNFMEKDLANSDLKFPTRSYGVNTLTRLRENAEEALIYKNILENGNLNPQSQEYLLIEAKARAAEGLMEEKSGGVFRPTYEQYVPSEESLPKAPAVEEIAKTENVAVKPVEAPEIKTENNQPTVEETDPSSAPEENISEKVEVVSSSPEQKTFDFKTKEVKGKIRFLYDEKNEVKQVQISEKANIKGDGNVNRVLVDNWKEKAGRYGMNKEEAQKNVESNIKGMIRYQKILNAGKFATDSPEYKFLKTNIDQVLRTYRDVLKR